MTTPVKYWREFALVRQYIFILECRKIHSILASYFILLLFCRNTCYHNLEYPWIKKLSYNKLFY